MGWIIAAGVAAVGAVAALAVLAEVPRGWADDQPIAWDD